MNENRRCSILFHFEGAWWHVADGDDEPDGGSEFRELGLPGPGPVAVGSSSVCGDEEVGSVGVAGSSHAFPPPGDRDHRERWGVVIVAHVDPALVGADVVHPIGDGLAHPGVGEVVGSDPGRLTLGLPLDTTVGVVADQLLLLAVNRDHRVSV
jgi:hypothetical protein